MDDLSNSVEESLNRVRELTKCDDEQLIFRKVRGVGTARRVAVFTPSPVLLL